MNMLRCCLALLLLLLPLAVLAHKPSDSYLILNLDGAVVKGQWDIALRDLEYAIGVDTDGDGAITWGELKSRHAAIDAYALARLTIAAGGDPCRLRPTGHLVDNHSDGAYAVLRFGVECSAAGPLTVDYRLFFDLDPLHRGLLQIRYPQTVQTAVLSPDQPLIELDRRARGAWRQFLDYWWEGVWHIWTGFDHMLFLLALLLPAVLWREAGRWRAVASFRTALLEVMAVVTGFTLAHSITLSAAVLGWVSLPSRWVESAIAATVVAAALNNLYPLVEGRRRWSIAFGLGLIHGFGFASVLKDLGLPGDALALALVGFNLGVETGQLAIVAAFLPIAFLLRKSWFYRRAAMGFGSLAVAAVAFGWLLERGLNLRLMPL